ncbi:GTP-binding protein ypt5-like, partial [Argonauta hians]
MKKSNYEHPKYQDISSPGNVQKVKVVTVGDISVGKSSLALRFTKGYFEDSYKPTVGAVFVFKTIMVGNRNILFQIWDTAGQERFKSLVPMYLRDAKFALLIYDITDQRTFEAIPSWLNYVTRYAPSDIQVTLVANKIDLLDNEPIDTQFAKTFADKHNICFEAVSAKTGENVEKLFNDLAQKVPPDIRVNKLPVNHSIKLTEEKKSIKKCCHHS